MDNLVGVLIVVGLVIAAIIWVVQMVILGVASSFVLLTDLFGHPAFVLVAAAALGAAGGMIALRRRHGAYTPTSAHDYAQIGALKLTPEHWSALVLGVLVVALAGYGLVVTSPRAYAAAGISAADAPPPPQSN